MLARILHIAIEQAKQSRMLYRHGAVLFTKRQIHTKGYNIFTDGANDSSVHAEMSCLAIKRIVKYSKCSILVVRLNSNNKLTNSKPCKDCLEKLKSSKIKNIYYSDGRGQIICEKVKNSTTSFVSSGTKYCLRHLFTEQ